MYPNKPEEFLGQIRTGDPGAWTDYARGHEEESQRWQEKDPTNRRVVHWIDRTVIFAAECDAFAVNRIGICGAQLSALDDCPNAHNHREV